MTHASLGDARRDAKRIIKRGFTLLYAYSRVMFDGANTAAAARLLLYRFLATASSRCRALFNVKCHASQFTGCHICR